MIEREHAISALDDGIEARKPDGTVEARAAVEGDEGPPLPPLVDVELDIADGDPHHAILGGLRDRPATIRAQIAHIAPPGPLTLPGLDP